MGAILDNIDYINYKTNNWHINDNNFIRNTVLIPDAQDTPDIINDNTSFTQYLDNIDNHVDYLVTNNELYFYTTDTKCDINDVYIVSVSLLFLAYFVYSNILPI